MEKPKVKIGWPCPKCKEIYFQKSQIHYIMFYGNCLKCEVKRLNEKRN